MENFKKNPLFYSAQIALGLVFLAGLAMSFLAYREKAESERLLLAAQTSNLRLLRGHVLAGKPHAAVSLTEENKAKAQEDVVELTAHIAALRASITGNPELHIRGKASANSAELYTVIKQSVDEWQRFAKEKEIKFQPGEPCEFGFRRYIRNPGTSPKRELQTVDKQRQVIDFLFRQLVEARPAGAPLLLESIDREPIETFILIPEGKPGAGTYAADPDNPTRESDEFKPERSFDQRGLVESLSFRLRFVGYTPTLRNFINKVRNSGRPFGITNVEVKRATPDLVKLLGAAPAPAAAAVTATPAAGAGSLFFADDAAPAPKDPKVATVPKEIRLVAVEETPSVFTVQIDYLSVVELPVTEGETKK